ncbi:hypothetical protein ACWERV_17250 [Streptomyces sp. NPDC004031]
MINKNIGITEPALGRPARLRADAIQRAALIAIGRVLVEDADRGRRLIDALEDLGTINRDPAEGELDGALGDVLDLAYLDTAAEMDLTAADTQQLADEAARAGAPAPVVQLPRQQDRRAAS